MNELIRKEGRMAALAGLAQEARFYSERAAMNILELGRVLIDAKSLVNHGEWIRWIRDNAGISDRTAQNLMAVYRRFGDNPQFAGIEKGKLFKMLALPEAQEEKFLEEHDVKAMTTREVEEAVRQAREEEQAAANALLEKERRARIEAEDRAQAAESRQGEIPEETRRELEEQREASGHFAELARKVGSEKAQLEQDNRDLRAKLEAQEQTMQEQQEAINQAQMELLELKSSQARGDYEQVGEAMSPAVFRQQVRAFLGVCCMLPQMGRSFRTMTTEDRSQYAEGLDALEQWLAGSRKAMNDIEGAFVIE